MSNECAALVMMTLALLNGGYIYWLHRRIQNLVENILNMGEHIQNMHGVHRHQAATIRRLGVSATDVRGKLIMMVTELQAKLAMMIEEANDRQESLVESLKKQADDVREQREALNRHLIKIVKDHLISDLAVSKHNGNGRSKGLAAVVAQANGTVPHERAGAQPY